MTRAEAFAVVRQHGGTPSEAVTKRTTLLIVGELGWPLLDDGRPSNKLSRATSYGVPVVSERRFLVELFYQEGIRAIGIDTLVARSGLSKSSLYRTFASKEELIAAFAEEQNRRFWQWWDETTTRHFGSPRQQIEALFDGIAEIACTNKREVCKRLRVLARALGARDPRQLSDQLALLIDGAYGHAVTLGAAGLRRELIEMATLLIDAQVGQENPEASGT